MLSYILVAGSTHMVLIEMPSEYLWENGILGCRDVFMPGCSEKIERDFHAFRFVEMAFFFITLPLYVYFFTKLVFRKAKYNIIPVAIMVAISSMLFPIVYHLVYNEESHYLVTGQLVLVVLAAYVAAKRLVKNAT